MPEREQDPREAYANWKAPEPESRDDAARERREDAIELLGKLDSALEHIPEEILRRPKAEYRKVLTDLFDDLSHASPDRAAFSRRQLDT